MTTYLRGLCERLFSLSGHGTSIRKEVIAGFTTFAAMSYILAVNPMILSQTGMDFGAVITATALAAAIGTALMAMMTNYPIALAPGMGLNAFFTYTITLGMGIPWEAALAMVFYNGVIFFFLAVTGLRDKLVDAIPHHLKIAITCGIGLFIAFIGLQNGGLITTSEATFVTLGDISRPAVLLILGGIFLTLILVARKIPGAILLSIILISAAGLFVPTADGDGPLTSMPDALISMPASLGPTFFALDFAYPFTYFTTVWPIILSLLFVDLFDTLGTLIGVSNRAGLLDEEGNLPKIGPALQADASTTAIGAILGTSTTTSYIESAAGVEAGGRTGLTAIVVSLCFLGSMLFTPLIMAIPASATAPALIVVGIFMMQGASELDFSDFTIAAPAVVTILMMPMAFSISEGIAFGLMVFVGLMAGLGRFREVTPLAYLLAVLFLMYYIF